MNCPRCGELNQEDSNVCTKCALKLKVTCPKCNTLNPVGKEKCLNCNLRLVTFCPNCKTANHPSQKTCRKCNKALYKACNSCRAVYVASFSQCPKCGSELIEKIESNQKIENKQNLNKTVERQQMQTEEIKEAPHIKTEELSEHAILSAELINLSVIKAKISQEELVTKLKNKFYHIVSKEAKNLQEVAKPLSEQVVAVRFKTAGSVEKSAYNAIIVAQKILDEINEFNYQIYNKLKIRLKVKIGVSLGNKIKRKYNCEYERNIATANNIIVSKEIHDLVIGKFDFETLGPFNISDKMIPFYRIKEQLSASAESEETGKENAIKSQQIQEKDIINQPEPKAEPQVQGVSKSRSTKAVQINIPNYQETQLSFNEAYNVITSTLTEPKGGLVFSISAPDGAGKSTMLNSVRNFLSKQNITWLVGYCQNTNQFVPFAFISDVLKLLFNLPYININTDESKKLVQKTLETLGISDPKVENTLRRLFFYEPADVSPDIFVNQQDIYNAVEVVLSALKAKTRIILLIEDFEFIDKASLGCLKYLINRCFFDANAQILLTSMPDINIYNFLYSADCGTKFAQIYLKPLMHQEANALILNLLGNSDILPIKVRNKIISKSNGWPLYIDQAIWLLMHTKAVFREDNILKFSPESANFELPDDVADIFKLKLSKISKLSKNAFNIVLCASVFGQRFMPKIVQSMAGVEEEEASKIFKLLANNGIFSVFDKYSMTFSHRIIWDILYREGFTPEQKASFHTRALQILRNFTSSNGAMLALHAELSNLNLEAYRFHEQAVSEAFYVGDIQAFTLSQQRMLTLVDTIGQIDQQEKEDIKLQIYENIGKFNYEVNPEISLQFLSKALEEREKQDDKVRVIDLAGYLSRSCELIGNYSAVMECADKALSIIKKDMHIESALLNYTKLSAAFNLGRLEEASNLAQNAVIPIIMNYLTKNKGITGLNLYDLLYIMLDAELTLAKTLAAQGNPDCIKVIDDVITKSKEYNQEDIIIQAEITRALFKILQGEVKAGVSILNSQNESISKSLTSKSLTLYSDFVKLTGAVIKGNYELVNDYSYKVLQLAEVHKDYNILALSKLFVGMLLYDANNIEQAKSVFNEVITYCSENKLATGAFLSWYLIAKTELDEANVDKALSIGENAIEISTKAHISNHYFTVLFYKIIAEAKLAKHDFEAASMNLEQGLDMARKMGSYFLEAHLYRIYGKVYQEATAELNDNKQINAKKAHEYFLKSLEIAQRIENDQIIKMIEEELNQLTTFCQLSGIIL